jgi:aldose 1-epimerase
VIELRTETSAVTIDPVAGGRVASLVVFGRELLVARDGGNHPFGWGSYPMVPWAGRVRRGRFHFDAAGYELEVDFPPHSIHGTAYNTPWSVSPGSPVSGNGSDPATATLECDLAAAKRWPFGGVARQILTLRPSSLELTLEVVATDRAMPVTLGWHPWWRRDIGDGSNLELDVDLRFARQYLKDAEEIPSGELITPRERPWDATFIGIREVGLRWPGVLRLRIDHDCSHVVIFDEPDHAICVEPQSGPPDAFAIEPQACRLEAGQTLRRTTTWSWSPDT